MTVSFTKLRDVRPWSTLSTFVAFVVTATPSTDDERPLQRLSILGSTGSIGTQTLEIVRLFPDRLHVGALAAHANVELLAAQAREFRPEVVVIGDEGGRRRLAQELSDLDVEILVGQPGLCRAATLEEADAVVAAVVGFAGLESVLAGVRAGKRIALANKETLVVAGQLVNRLASRSNSRIVPVDSEHSAIYQCLVGEPRSRVEELILTASGGPFRTRARHTFASITKAEALDHPNWSMGAKITIDSATMMNKGLEVVEARWLFGIEPDRISVLVHPQSIVHSLVTFEDGSTKAQLGIPDMKVPIQYALSCPDRWPAPHERLDWSSIRRLEFDEPDFDRFPCLELAYEALRRGGSAPAVLNAANEQAVALFLQEKIRFVDIPDLIADALDRIEFVADPSFEELVDADNRARLAVLEHTRAGTI